MERPALASSMRDHGDAQGTTRRGPDVRSGEDGQRDPAISRDQGARIALIVLLTLLELYTPSVHLRVYRS